LRFGILREKIFRDTTYKTGDDPNSGKSISHPASRNS
jgi:hypothetical protein